jgi:hypothetical protein
MRIRRASDHRPGARRRGSVHEGGGKLQHASGS